MNSRFRSVLFPLVFVVVFAACNRETATPGGAVRSDGGPVIIISIDTLRADHLPIYGAKGIETPNIDALAADSIVFENAYSHVPLTLPSHVTMLTGLLPADAGVRNNLGYRFDSKAHPSLPLLLKEKGYATGAAVSAYVLRGATGLGGAFDHYDDQMDRGSEGGAMGEVQRSGKATVASAVRWIEAKRGQPYFFMLHLFEPHTPYAPPEPFKSRYANTPYDGEIATADADVGTFLDALKQSGDYDRATIVLMADHGEGLGDHGEAQHGIFLYREAIHVPLVVKLPGGKQKGERVKVPAQLIDVLPTIAEIAGFPVPEKAKGLSLIGLAGNQAATGRRIFSETMYPRIHLGWSDLASLVDATHHYIDAPKPELYDLVADRAEKVNVLEDNRRVYASMRSEVQKHDRTLAPPTNVDPEEAAKLAALGYLGSSSATSAGTKLLDPKDGFKDFERTGTAQSLVSAGKYGEAVAMLREIVSRNPSHADAWTLLARALERMGQVDEAIEAYKKTMEVAPMLAPGTAISMAELYMRAGRFDDARKHAELAIGSHPGAARLLVAEAHLAMKDFAAAERESSLIDDPSKQNDAAVLLAQVRIAQRRLPEAMALLDQTQQRAAATTQKVPPNFWFARADALARLNRLAEAEQAFGEEIRMYPRNREAYIRLGVLQILTGRESEANRTFETMVKLNPDASSRPMVEGALRTLRQQRRS
jgi:arylsulfatase A-like enzyme/Flp pilus assembly protein TadD